MSSQGPLFVASGANGTGTWTNPGNVTADDGSTASISMPGGNGGTIRCTMGGNPFSVPGGATINGVLVEIKSQGVDSFGGTITFNVVTLVQGGAQIGTNQASGSPSNAGYTYISFGGATNLMGATLSAAVVNSATFGVDIAYSDSGGGPGQVDIDAVRITVYYSGGAGSVGFSTLCGWPTGGWNSFIGSARRGKVSYKPGDAIVEEFSVSGTSGGLVNADSLPTATLAHNGTDDGAVTLTVANISTGRYKVTGTIPSTYAAGDKIQIWVAATVSTVAGGGPILSSVLDSNRLADVVIRNGTAQAGAAGTITLDASASATNDFYKDCWVKIVSGTGAGQVRYISAYNGTTKVASISPNWITNPDATSVFLVLPAAYVGSLGDKTGMRLATDVRSGTAQAGAAGTITLDAGASATDNFYKDCWVEILSGTGSGQVRYISGYTGTSKVAAIAPNWAVAPDNTSVFVVLPAAEVNAASGVTYPTNFSSLKITPSGDMSLGEILGTDLSEGAAGQLAGGFKKWFDVSAPAYTLNNVNDAYARIGVNGAGLTTLGDTRLGFLDAAVSTRLPTASYTAPLSSAAVAAAVLDAPTASHSTAGTVGAAIASAGSAGDPWATLEPGSYAVGTFGHLLATNLDATVSSRSTYAGGPVASVTGAVGSVTADVGITQAGADKVWGSATRTLTAVDKNGYNLASTGLDSISIAAPAGVPTTFREMLVLLYRWFFKKSDFNKTTGLAKAYADDGTTVITTQTWTDDGTTQTKGAAA